MFMGYVMGRPVAQALLWNRSSFKCWSAKGTWGFWGRVHSEVYQCGGNEDG